MTATSIKDVSGKYGPATRLGINRRYEIYLNGIWAKRFNDMSKTNKNIRFAILNKNRIIFSYFGKLFQTIHNTASLLPLKSSIKRIL